MGTGKGPANYEFNVLLSHYDDGVFATEEFDALWAEGVVGVDLIRKVLKRQKGTSVEHLGRGQSARWRKTN